MKLAGEQLSSRWWVVACLLAALALRLPGLGNPPTDIHSVAQSQSASIARNMARQGIDLSQARIDWGGAHPAPVESGLPLYEALCALGWQDVPYLSAVHHAWARGLSVLGWLLGTVALWLWVRRRLPGPRLPYLLLYLFSPLCVVFSRNLQPDMFALGLFLWGLERLDRSRGGGRRELVWLVAGALLLGLASSVDGSLILLLPLALLVAGTGEGGALAPSRGVSALVLALSVPTYWFLHFVGLDSGGILAAMFGAGDSPWGGASSWFSLTSVRALGGNLFVVLLTPLGFLALVAGGKTWLGEREFRPFVLGLVLVGLSVLVFTGAFSRRSFELLPAIPFASVLAGAGIGACFRGTSRVSPALAWKVSGVLLLVAMVTGLSFGHRSLQRDRRIETIGHIVAASVLKESPIVVSDRHPQTLLYAMDRRGWQRGALSLADLSDLERLGARFLLLTDTSPSWSNRPFRVQVAETRRVVARTETWLLIGLKRTGGTGGISGGANPYSSNAPPPQVEEPPSEPVPAGDSAEEGAEEAGSGD